MTGLHNHAAEFNGQGKAVLGARSKWIKSLHEIPTLQPMTAIKDERRRYPMDDWFSIHVCVVCPIEDSNQDLWTAIPKVILLSRCPMSTARQIHLLRHIRTARRQRGKRRPATTRTPEALHEAVTARAVPKYTVTEDGERLLSFFFPKTKTVVLTTRRQLDLLPRNAEIHGDATYKVVKNSPFGQLFTLHANWDGYVSDELILFPYPSFV